MSVQSPVGTHNQCPLSRRDWLQSFGMGFGGIALAGMLDQEGTANPQVDPRRIMQETRGGVLTTFHTPPKAKRVIYLFQSGGPSQLDLFDYKPLLVEKSGEQLPESVRDTQRLTGMSGHQS